MKLQTSSFHSPFREGLIISRVRLGLMAGDHAVKPGRTENMALWCCETIVSILKTEYKKQKKLTNFFIYLLQAGNDGRWSGSQTQPNTTAALCCETIKMLFGTTKNTKTTKKIKRSNHEFTLINTNTQDLAAVRWGKPHPDMERPLSNVIFTFLFRCSLDA